MSGQNLEILIKSKYEKGGVDEATKGVEALREGVEEASLATAGFAATAVMAGTALVTAFVTAAHEVIDLASAAEKWTNVAAATGLGVVQVQQLQHFLEDAGFSAGDLSIMMKRLDKEISGGGDALHKFGISVLDIRNMAPEQQLQEIARQVMAIEDPTIRAAAAMAAFGKTGAEHLSAIARIAQGAYQEFGALSETQVKGLEDLDHALDNAGRAVKDFKTQMVARAANGREFTDLLNDWAIGVRALAIEVKKLGDNWKGTAAWQAGAMAAGAGAFVGAKDRAPGTGRDINLPPLPKLLPGGMTLEEWDAMNKAANEVAERYRKEALADARRAATQQKALEDEIFRFKIATAKEENRADDDFWKEQERRANNYGKILLRNIHEQQAANKEFYDAWKRYEEELRLLEQQRLDGLRDFGDALSNVGQQLGGFAGGVAALAAGAVKAFANLSDETVRARTEIQKMAVALNAAAAAYQAGSWEEGAAQGAAAGAQWGIWGAVIGAVAGALLQADGAQKKLNEEWRKAQIEGAKYILVMGGLDVLKKKAEEAGISLKALFDATNVADYIRALQNLQGQFDILADANKGLTDAMDKWGISIEQLGPKFKQQKMDEIAMDLLKDFDLLNAAGVDWLVLIDKMGPAINDFVNRSIAAGTTVPEAWRAILQKMIDNHELLDENGKAYESIEQAGIHFAQSVTGAIQELIDKITDLVNALLGIPNIKRTIELDTTTNPPPPPNTNPNNSPDHNGNPDYAHGGVVLPFVRRFASGGIAQPRAGGMHIPGLGTVAEAGQAELVAPVKAFAAEVAKAALAAGGGGEVHVHVHNYIGGDKLDDVLVKRERGGFLRR